MQEPADRAYLREQAAKCHRLADRLTDPKAIAALRALANEYEDALAKPDDGDMPVPPQTE